MKTRAVEGHLLPRGFEFNNNQKKTAFARDPSTQDPSTRPKRRDPSTADPSTGRPKNRPTQAPADQSTARPKHRPTKAPADQSTGRRKTQNASAEDRSPARACAASIQLFASWRLGKAVCLLVLLQCAFSVSIQSQIVITLSAPHQHTNQGSTWTGAARYLSWAHGGSWLLN